ncbi:DUF4328 domain-containing protein [Nonomuraea coxensis]|uniref:DUF4328 domain-containing protein n=1 Tax=Nonomuraea coxensis TaxID=404386 RepID=UPI00037A2F35|nr:DUF4328 domain-containing protein [Nonomuraea coxensis]
MALVADSLVGVVAAGIDLWYAAFVDRIIADVTSVTDEEIDTADLVYGLSGIVETVAYLAAVVGFLVWLFRVRANAEILAPDGHRRSRPWLILGWIVPIVSLWFPKQIVDDIWDASVRSWTPRKGLLHAWWAAWLIGAWVSNVAARVLFNAEEAEALAAAARFDVVSIALMLVAAVLAILVVLRISGEQEKRRTETTPVLHPGAPAPTGWA